MASKQSNILHLLSWFELDSNIMIKKISRDLLKNKSISGPGWHTIFCHFSMNIFSLQWELDVITHASNRKTLSLKLFNELPLWTDKN